MAFCAKCGAQLIEGATFCGQCGTAVGAVRGGAGGASSSVPTTSAAPMASNVAGLLAYVLGFITGIIFLVMEPYKNDKFVRFHAFQSVFFSVALIVFWIAFSIVSTILNVATLGILAVFMGIIGVLISLAFLAYWIFLMFKAYNHERYMIPYIGNLAARQAG
jgi:uncharacterized membrane protein